MGRGQGQRPSAGADHGHEVERKETHERACSRPRFSESLIASSSSLKPSCALRLSRSSSSSSSVSQSTPLPFLLAVDARPALARPLPLPPAAPAAACFLSPPSAAFLIFLVARGLGAEAGLASRASLRLPLRSGAPGCALAPESGAGSDCFEA